MSELNKREKSILKTIIQQFIVNAAPVGSAEISRLSKTGLKPASVRRIMNSLEEKGYLTQPHISAGRMPTTKGYRYYVDELIKIDHIGFIGEELINETMQGYDGDVNILMEKIARVLAQMSSQLSIMVTPRVYQGVFDHLQIAPISVDKLMVIIALKAGQVKTILLEVKHKINRSKLNRVIDIINKRFHGKSLLEIRNSFRQVLSTLRRDDTGLIRLFAETSDRLFDFSHYEDYRLNGASNIINQPEFYESQSFYSLFELLEDRNIFINFLEQREEPPGMHVTIGAEHHQEQMKNCSVITSTYHMGDFSGVIGIIGPTRMPYRRMIPLVEYTAKAITNKLCFP